MPAPYPIFPYNAGWENQIGFEAKPIEIQYGKGGTAYHARKGINNVKRNFQVQFIVSATLRNTIEAFLTDLGGRLPFWFYWEGLSVPDQSVTYTCSEWQWVPVGQGAWQFQGTFKQAYRW